MSQYYTLLKNDKIDFSDLLLEKYPLIGLDEINCIILIKLKNLFKENKNASEKTIISYLVKEMTINEEELNKRIIDLINSQYISLEEETQAFSLNGTYKRLSALYDSEEENTNKTESENDLKKCAALIEKECEHLLSQTELEVIKHWLEVDKYTYAEIKEATLASVSHKRKSVKYIDLFLNKEKEKKENKQTVSENDELSALFNAAVYGKKSSK